MQKEYIPTYEVGQRVFGAASTCTNPIPPSLIPVQRCWGSGLVVALLLGLALPGCLFVGDSGHVNNHVGMGPYGSLWGWRHLRHPCYPRGLGHLHGGRAWSKTRELDLRIGVLSIQSVDRGDDACPRDLDGLLTW